MMIKKYLVMGAIIAILSVIAAQCGATPTPETITKVETVVVEKEVKVVETVEVEKEVEVQVAGETLQFWSTEVQPARAEKTKEILNRFEEQSGIHVELILTDENALPELTTAAVAAGTLPDVMFHPIDFTIGWAEQGILDPAAAAAVIEKLGPETFAEGPLNLAQVEGGYAAIPTDGWASSSFTGPTGLKPRVWSRRLPSRPLKRRPRRCTIRPTTSTALPPRPKQARSLPSRPLSILPWQTAASWSTRRAR
jgi:maltose-binding protein MalE